MPEYIEKLDRNGRKHICVKFHKPLVRFKRIETLKLNGQFYKIYVNRNDSVYRIEQTKVVSWKEVKKGTRKLRVPDAIEVIPLPRLLNKVKGNPYKIAIDRITSEFENEIIL